MKKVILSICTILFVALYSCDERDDLRSDIDNLKERVANLEASIEQMNTDINNYQQMVAGVILVMGYNQDELGNYTVELSNGETVNIYSGKADMNDMPLFSINASGNWAYTINGVTTELLFNNQPVNAIPETGAVGITPKMKVDANGFWLISLDNGSTWSKLGNNQIADGTQATSSASSVFSNVVVNEATGEITFTIRADNSEVTIPIYGQDFYLNIQFEGAATFGLKQIQEFIVQQANVETAVIENQTWGIKLEETKLTVTAPSTNPRGEAYEDVIYIKIFSKEGYCRVVKLPVKLLNSQIDANATTAWTEFLSGDAENVLLDFSYAGYMRGETAPPNVETLVAQGYKVYDVTDPKYGAVPNDNKSDREAFLKVLADIAGTTYNKEDDNGTIRFLKEHAKAIIYFPEGRFILQDESSKNKTIDMTMGDIVLKGAGRDRTIIEMTAANNSASESQMWNAPVMMEFKHYSTLSYITDINMDASIGSKTVSVTSTSGLKANDWICLTMANTDDDVINAELAPYKYTDINVNNGGVLDIKKNGVQIYEYHQIEKISGSSVTFKEPIMHAINKEWGWKINKYPHYENVGVEDLTFKGDAVEQFVHHKNSIHDGGFKPIDFVRLTNSWIRRVNFESVSEAMSITNSANCSAYDIKIGGKRGHSAIRSQASSRIFIGKVIENSDGYTLNKGEGDGTLGTYQTNVGQYHACGVSKQSMGAVIWNVRWGDDSCFESHATQPRATLIDCCSGGFMHWRQGGDSAQMPNHMENLTIWNFNATKVQTDADIDTGGNFSWWDTKGYWWKFMPPIVVGFHGASLNFNEDQMKRLENNRSTVEPYSLYEAQLRHRLGYVPGWLNALK
ncbi:DUF4955 domain-containing protein [Bacteroides faecium]|uniref:DUF4955 domain-containing protein n=1 Tax=Bacteroides faecium TaxID=2715212 RepID=A0A6H0KMC4_9BACE|nr:DUF4955 domain-containing protein [Bacteroides faecium]QIU93728.1 DUF4955 domain-containing protein [Bacteroides faecium]